VLVFECVLVRVSVYVYVCVLEHREEDVKYMCICVYMYICVYVIMLYVIMLYATCYMLYAIPSPGNHIRAF
jgi:hypothetical protein